MKKILFLLLAIMTFIGITNAEEYYFNYRTNNTYAYMTTNAMYKNGFIFTDTGSQEGTKTFITYYSSDNKLIKSNIITDVEIHYLTTDDNYIYALGYNQNDRKFYMLKIDENLEVVKTKNVNNYYFPLFERYYYLRYHEGTGLPFLVVENNTIKIFSYPQNIPGNNYPYVVTTMNTDLENITVKGIMESNDFQNFRLALENLYPSIDEDADSYLYTEPIMLEDDLLLSSTIISGVCFDKNNINDNDLKPKLLDDDCSITAHLTLYDDNGNQLWDKAFPKYRTIQNLRVTSKYIVALARLFNSDGNTIGGTDVIIMDHKGNILQTIERQKEYVRLEANDTALIFTSFEQMPCVESFPYDADYCTNKNQHEVYLLEYIIETKVTKGKGTIEAIKSSKPGEPVTFVVTPGEGYVLGEVKVTDATGKTIVFKQNVFTMPTADVMIEAEFLPINPETKDMAIALIIMLSIVTLVITIVEGKKLKFLGV